MNAQPANRNTNNATFLVRFVLWLVAVLSLADLAPATGESSRFARLGAIWSETVETAGHRHHAVLAQIQLNSTDFVPSPVLEPQGDEPAIDGDDSATTTALTPRGKAAAPGGIAAAQCPDGQPLTAFNSRAPPALA